MDLTVRHETWPLAKVFRISRGARTAAEVVYVELRDGPHRGHAECVPYPHYGESIASVCDQIEELRHDLTAGLDRAALQTKLPAGAARNAVDCALWDLDAKRARTRVWQLAGVPEPQPAVCSFTISLGTLEEMESAARESAHFPLLKIKLGGDDDVARVEAVRRGAPRSRLIVDANEAWSPEQLPQQLPVLAELGVALVEQPLLAGHDAALADVPHAVPVCADESCHTADQIPDLAARYDFINIKIDKTGGLTEALRCVEAAREHRLGVMVGTMVGTSLAMAPATLVMHAAEFVDLDGPLWMAKDRPHALTFEHGKIHPPVPALWG